MIMTVPQPVKSPIASISVVKDDMILPTLFSWKYLWDNLSVFRNISCLMSLSILDEATRIVKRMMILPINKVKATIIKL